MLLLKGRQPVGDGQLNNSNDDFADVNKSTQLFNQADMIRAQPLQATVMEQQQQQHSSGSGGNFNSMSSYGQLETGNEQLVHDVCYVSEPSAVQSATATANYANDAYGYQRSSRATSNYDSGEIITAKQTRTRTFSPLGGKQTSMMCNSDEPINDFRSSNLAFKYA